MSIADAADKLNIAKSHLRRIAVSGTVHKRTGLTFNFV